MSYFPIKIEITEGADKGKQKICNVPEDTPQGISFKVIAINVQPEKPSKLSQYMKSYSYNSLMKHYSLDDYGVWQIRGEDPNCDFGGHHHEPLLETVEGKLEDVIKYGVELPRFWQWGAGGSFVKVEVSKKV